jgi:hypothetical protein
MDYQKLVSGEKNEVLAYVVFKEHTLGYLFCIGKTLYLGILHGNIFKGGYDWKIGNVIINPFDFEHVRKATEKDFDDYRVLSNGYNLT